MLKWLRDLSYSCCGGGAAWRRLGSTGTAAEVLGADLRLAIQFAAEHHGLVKRCWPELAATAVWGWPGVEDDAQLMAAAAEQLARHTTGEDARGYQRLARRLKAGDKRHMRREVRYRLDWPDCAGRIRFGVKFPGCRDQFPGIDLRIEGPRERVGLTVAFWSSALGGGFVLRERDARFIAQSTGDESTPIVGVLTGIRTERLGVLSWWQWSEHGHGGPQWPSPRSQVVSLEDQQLLDEALGIALEEIEANGSSGGVILNSWKASADYRFL